MSSTISFFVKMSLNDQITFFIEDVKSFNDGNCNRHIEQATHLYSQLTPDNYRDILSAFCTIAYRIQPMVEPLMIKFLECPEYKELKTSEEMLYGSCFFSFPTFEKIYDRIGNVSNAAIICTISKLATKFYWFGTDYIYFCQSLLFLELKKKYPTLEDMKQIFAYCRLSSLEFDYLANTYGPLVLNKDVLTVVGYHCNRELFEHLNEKYKGYMKDIFIPFEKNIR